MPTVTPPRPRPGPPKGETGLRASYDGLNATSRARSAAVRLLEGPAQVPFDDLPGLGSGQILLEPQLPGAFVAGQVGPAVGQERLGQRRGRLDSGGGNDDGHGPPTEGGGGQPDRPGVGHRQMLEEDVLGFPGIDVYP